VSNPGRGRRYGPAAVEVERMPAVYAGSVCCAYIRRAVVVWGRRRGALWECPPP
jgi:hypothetical protein